jgi:hypothetical protein
MVPVSQNSPTPYASYRESQLSVITITFCVVECGAFKEHGNHMMGLESLLSTGFIGFFQGP